MEDVWIQTFLLAKDCFPGNLERGGIQLWQWSFLSEIWGNSSLSVVDFYSAELTTTATNCKEFEVVSWREY